VIKQQLAQKCNVIISRHMLRMKYGGEQLDRNKLARELKDVKFVTPKDKKLLVSTMESTDALVITSPLLRWYIMNGMHVTIHQFLEYKRARCFSKFVKMVTQARQTSSPQQSESWKLLGNAAFGSVLLRTRIYLLACRTSYGRKRCRES